MKLRHCRLLVVLLAALMGGGFVAGCEDESDWEHPNRQRYPAPPLQESDSMSVEELERKWREQDARAARAAGQQQPIPQQHQKQLEGQEATSDMLDVAMAHLESALEAVMTGAADQSAPIDDQEALGGGPSPGARPPADNGAGEM